MMQNTWKNTKTLAYSYSYERTQCELSNEYQHDKVLDVFQKYLHPCALDKSSLSICVLEELKKVYFIGSARYVYGC